MTLVLLVIVAIVLMMLIGVPVGFSFGLGGFCILFLSGIDPVHFAAISVTNLALGNVTPPCAPMLYLAGMIGGNLPLAQYARPAACFMIFGALPVILLVTYVPQFALVLVKLLL